MLKNFLRNKSLILIIDIILLIIVIICSKYIFEFEMQKNLFVSNLEMFIKENETPVFKVGKIILYQSAKTIDSSNGKLENINISQFTDIAIYIDNKSKIKELTAENTVKEIYIDNIKLKMNLVNGDYILNYKNPKEFGKFLSIKNCETNQILFNVISKNEENIKADYSKSTFYTDCSNPITLGFINRNIIKNGVVSDISGQLSFDGSILGNANIDLESVSGKIEMMIHIKNNLGEDFICNSVINNDLNLDKDSLLNGYSILIDENQNENSNFIKCVNK